MDFTMGEAILAKVFTRSEDKLNCDEKEEYSEDRISQLPDHILISIMSFMTLREAASTYVVSKRWHNLWADIVSMNFDATKIRYDIYWEHELFVAKRNKFVSFVNQVLKTHKNPVIDDFRVCFQMDNDNKCDIDRWFDFAIKKRVKRFEMNFKQVPWASYYGYDKSYTIPNTCYEYIRTPQGLLCIRSLTSLCFRYVYVSEEVIEHFLSNCPFLEKLAVESSRDLVNLRVVSGKFQLRLKNLEISCCMSLEKLEISALFLVSFVYYGSRIELSIRDVPLLVDISINGNDDQTYVLSTLSSYLCKLETLTLTVNTNTMNFSDLTELTNLKYLTVAIYATYRDSMLGLIPLLNASPFITKLKVKLYTHPKYLRMVEEERFITKIPHKSLKIVEMIGFAGCRLDREIAEYALESCIMLEKLIIDCQHSSMIGKPRWWLVEESEEGKQYAFRLKENFPSKVEVIMSPN